MSVPESQNPIIQNQVENPAVQGVQPVAGDGQNVNFVNVCMYGLPAGTVPYTAFSSAEASFNQAFSRYEAPQLTLLNGLTPGSTSSEKSTVKTAGIVAPGIFDTGIPTSDVDPFKGKVSDGKEVNVQTIKAADLNTANFVIRKDGTWEANATQILRDGTCKAFVEDGYTGDSNTVQKILDTAKAKLMTENHINLAIPGSLASDLLNRSPDTSTNPVQPTDNTTPAPTPVNGGECNGGGGRNGGGGGGNGGGGNGGNGGEREGGGGTGDGGSSDTTTGGGTTGSDTALGNFAKINDYLLGKKAFDVTVKDPQTGQERTEQRSAYIPTKTIPNFTQRMMPPGLVARLSRVSFANYDTDGDGKLSPAEEEAMKNDPAWQELNTYLNSKGGQDDLAKMAENINAKADSLNGVKDPGAEAAIKDLKDLAEQLKQPGQSMGLISNMGLASQLSAYNLLTKERLQNNTSANVISAITTLASYEATKSKGFDLAHEPANQQEAENAKTALANAMGALLEQPWGF